MKEIDIYGCEKDFFRGFCLSLLFMILWVVIVLAASLVDNGETVRSETQIPV